MPYSDEFPDFAPGTMPEIPSDWTDTSCGQEMCPTFRAANGLVILVDYADPEDREIPDSRRYVVATSGPAPVDILESDDWHEVVRFVRAYH